MKGHKEKLSKPFLPQGPIPAGLDLRDMLRTHLVARSLACLEAAAERRRKALRSGRIDEYCRALIRTVRNFYGTLPAGEHGPAVRARTAGAHEKRGFRVENVLFDSFPGWEVNANVFVPLDFRPPFPAVVVPVGHSGKQYEDYQLPAQFFARAGYLAVTFDPPGQDSEKKPGNDHFVDGVRPYLVGETSSRYFVADALRVIDYLETRDDADLTAGVCMTGVSGGGRTTTLASLLDERITVAGPSCCLSPLADLDVTQCYAGCPETHEWRRYADGVDEVDLLCAACPKPLLILAGERDEVFHIEDTRRLAGEVQQFYEAAGKGDHFEFFVDSSGHGYSLEQARRMVCFMDRRLRKTPERDAPDLPHETFSAVPFDELRCFPRTDVNMRTLTLQRARELAASRNGDPERIRRAARKIAGAASDAKAPLARTGEPFRVWVHRWQQVLIKPEEGIALPATFLIPDQIPAPAILHFDDGGRHRHICNSALLTRAIQFVDRDRPGFCLLSADLRGWGDSAPAAYPYEMASWGSVDRCLAYMSAALGDAVMAQRMRDGLACLAYLRTRPEVDSENIVVSGCGLGGVVALHAAAIGLGVKGVVVWDSLVSFLSLLEAENYPWPADAFVPNVLCHYDLPELAASLECTVKIFRPLDGEKIPLAHAAAEKFNGAISKDIYTPNADPSDIAACIQRMLESSRR